MNQEELQNAMHDPARGKESGGIRSNDPRSPVSNQGGKTFIDARSYNSRFGKPNYSQVGATASGTPVMNQVVVNGDDPLKLYLHESSSSKGKKIPDFEKIEACLFQLPRYDPNFHPLKEILSHAHWSNTDKARVLRQVMQYSVDIEDPSRGKAIQTPLEVALELGNNEAAMVFIGHGAELNKPNLKGLKAMHLAAMHGMPDLMAVMAQRGGTAGMTGEGSSLADLAMKRFEKKLEKTKELIGQPEFETHLDTYYKSLAVVKKFKLYDGPWDFSKHKKKLNELTERFPGYKPFIETMEQSLNDIESETDPAKKITYPPSRAYTNPGKAFNDPVFDNFEHSWLGFMSFMDRATENMQRSNLVANSRNKVATCLRNMDQLTDLDAIQYLQKNRRTINLDFVVNDITLNPYGDTLLTRAIRDKKYEVAAQLLELDVNMHATDKNGDTALHLLAKTCTDKAEFLLFAKQMIGVPIQTVQLDAKGEEKIVPGRKSLLQHENLSDWYVLDAQGKTFIDVLRETHPEWTSDHPDASWLQDIERQLGIPVADNDIPLWSVQRMMRLGGPEEVLRLRKNAAALQLADETLPTLDPLDPLATNEERNEQVTRLLDTVSLLQKFKQKTTDPEKSKEIRERLRSIVGKQDPETKMRTLLLFTDKMDSLTAEQMEGQTTIMRSLANDMKTGDAQEKANIFTVFDKASEDAQKKLINYFQAQGVLQDTPPGMVGAIDDFKDAAKTLSELMEAHAGVTYGSTTPNENPKGDGVVNPPKP